MSRSRAKGTWFETLTVGGFQTRWADTHRLGNQGVRDCGDLWLPPSTRLAVEDKNEASYAGKLSTWVREAQTEAERAGREFGVVVHKRYGTRRWQDQFVTTDLHTFIQGWGFQ